MVEGTTQSQWVHPTGGSPKRVVILALGPSHRDYVGHMLASGPPIEADEVWTVNLGCRVFQYDLVFSIDDCKYLESVNPFHAEGIKQCKKPVITSVAYDDYPTTYSFPLSEVLNMVGPDHYYFNNTVAYMLAYALAIGVESIDLYGSDYTHPSLPHDTHEAGRGCAEFWVGFLRAKGVDVKVTQGSTLTDAHTGRPPYGYVIPPRFVQKPVEPDLTPEGAVTPPDKEPKDGKTRAGQNSRLPKNPRKKRGSSRKVKSLP